VFLFSCKTTEGLNTNTTDNSSSYKNANVHRDLINLGVEFMDKIDYFIYILPENIIMENGILSDKGKAILDGVHDVNKKYKADEIFVLGHSSVLSENPLEKSKIIAELTSKYLVEIYNFSGNITTFAKSNLNPIYGKKSYSHYKKNERVEIIIIKNRKGINVVGK
jgi:hypothetical protein